jgi:hypothetical protein
MTLRRIFWGKPVWIGPLHYVSSHSDVNFEFSEIFVIEKRLAELGVNKITYRYNFFQTFKLSNGNSTLHHWLLFYQIDLLKSWYSRLM